MNSKTLAKIEAGAPFLLQFRSEVPGHLQSLVTPYLDQPYQLALKILDYSLEGDPLSANEISTRIGISKATVYQVLNALERGSFQLQNQLTQWQWAVEIEKELTSTA